MNIFEEFIVKKKKIISWNNTHKKIGIKVYPRNVLELKKIMLKLKKNKKYYIIKTGACSYGSKSIHANNDTFVISLKKFNKITLINKKKKFIDIEVGAKIKDVVKELKKHKLTLYSVPGGEHISIGGAISANVIGKDSSKSISCFGDGIIDLEILDENNKVKIFKKSKNINNYVGALGTTGLMLKARLKIKEIKSPNLYVQSIILKNLKEIKNELNKKNDYQYIQIDPFFRNKNFAILFKANFIKSENNLYKKINLKSYLYERIFFKISSFFINSFSWNIFYKIFFLKNNDKKYYIDLHNYHYSSKYKHMVPLICRGGLYDYEILIKKEFSKSMKKIINFLKENKLLPIYIVVKKIYKSKNKFFYKFNENGYAVAISLNKKDINNYKTKLLVNFIENEKFKINLSKTDELFIDKINKKNNLFLSLYKKMIVKDNELSR